VAKSIVKNLRYKRYKQMLLNFAHLVGAVVTGMGQALAILPLVLLLHQSSTL
jgi:hypothetical protein